MVVTTLISRLGLSKRLILILVKKNKSMGHFTDYLQSKSARGFNNIGLSCIIRTKGCVLCSFGILQSLFTYLGGAGSTCADITSTKHLFIAQDASSGVLLVVQELLECAETSLGV